ncbi:MAG: hypothetical protein PF505_13595 [Vallitaleaceae bacterium]|nr:hypothetical protein [Vallitaleaceae bacterium]
MSKPFDKTSVIKHTVMAINDIEKTLKAKPNSRFIIVHLDAINQCIESSGSIKNQLIEL